MTVKEIYEKTTFGVGNLNSAGVQDYNVYYCGSTEMYLEMYKKASRKNASQKYRNIKALLDREAVVVMNTSLKVPNYTIITRRSFEGAFSEPLKEYQKIIIK